MGIKEELKNIEIRAQNDSNAIRQGIPDSQKKAALDSIQEAITNIINNSSINSDDLENLYLGRHVVNYNGSSVSWLEPGNVTLSSRIDRDMDPKVKDRIVADWNRLLKDRHATALISTRGNELIIEIPTKTETFLDKVIEAALFMETLSADVARIQGLTTQLANAQQTTVDNLQSARDTNSGYPLGIQVRTSDEEKGTIIAGDGDGPSALTPKQETAAEQILKEHAKTTKELWATAKEASKRGVGTPFRG